MKVRKPTGHGFIVGLLKVQESRTGTHWPPSRLAIKLPVLLFRFHYHFHCLVLFPFRLHPRQVHPGGKPAHIKVVHGSEIKWGLPYGTALLVEELGRALFAGQFAQLNKGVVTGRVGKHLRTGAIAPGFARL